MNLMIQTINNGSNSSKEKILCLLTLKRYLKLGFCKIRTDSRHFLKKCLRLLMKKLRFTKVLEGPQLAGGLPKSGRIMASRRRKSQRRKSTLFNNYIIEIVILIEIKSHQLSITSLYYKFILFTIYYQIFS